jgi:drug/metabolite transporter (DMT)-like permease
MLSGISMVSFAIFLLVGFAAHWVFVKRIKQEPDGGGVLRKRFFHALLTFTTCVSAALGYAVLAIVLDMRVSEGVLQLLLATYSICTACVGWWLLTRWPGGFD